jgi:hypothetical protein
MELLRGMSEKVERVVLNALATFALSAGEFLSGPAGDVQSETALLAIILSHRLADKSIHLGSYNRASIALTRLNADNLNGRPTFRFAMRREMRRSL